MSEFEIIANNKEYETILLECNNAETATFAVEKAKYCRQALIEMIQFIYRKEQRHLPVSATLLELIDGNVITEFIPEPVIRKSLHFVRMLGMNAINGLHIKKTESKLALENISFFVHYIYNSYLPKEQREALLPPRYMSEAATRKLYIDRYLNEAGWDVIQANSTTKLPDGTEVQTGIVYPAKACCEIPVNGMPNVSGIGFCDYVLYGKNGKPLAIIEAKKTSVEALVGQQQVKTYGECMKQQYGYIPILYYTNGYEIYVIDGLYPSRQVAAFHSLDELEYMLQKRQRNDITDMKINDEISGRPYQKMAVTNVCERFNQKFRRSLLVMATGTGKTRVAISIVDVLLRNHWIKNVLFLADRTSLVEQACKNFKKILPNMSYCVLSDRSIADEPNARIIFSTHQTMINDIDAEKKEFTCGHFDLIIIDEAHRSIFNKFGTIFEYFDALLIGLTATPKDEVDANTYQLFNCESGEPNFAYSLEEAIKDKFLVSSKICSRTTQLLSQGVRYSDLSDTDKKNVESVLEDDIDETYILPKEKLFKIFYNIDTCAKVLDDLMTNGQKVDNGRRIGKTIIFAYNHRHAELIVDTFKKIYPKLGDDYCLLIDNKVKGATKLIEKFEEEGNIRIAVSVDMLDTGVDVPSVLNLVFFKPVKSRIKFIQMIGRGTRLCPNLIDGKDKEYSLIFDYCGNFEYFDLHPEGETANNGKSISQKLFDIKLDILVELQSYEHQTDEACKTYYDKLKPNLYHKIYEIKETPSRICVREEMSYVDKYVDYERWDGIAPLAKKEIQLHLSKLIDPDLKEDNGALRFDVQMLQIELSILASGGIGRASKQVENVRKICKILLDNQSSQPAVFAKAESLKTIVSVEFWSNPRVDQLEIYREEIRDLLKYLPHSSGAVNINACDIVLDGEYTGTGLVDIRTYKEKVIDYLAEHSENLTIRKIQQLEPIDAADLKELERILWHELGTPEDYHNTTDLDNLAAFIRSIVGVEQEVINEKFGEFLSGNVLNSQQQEFVKAIIDYVRENGDISAEDLIEKSPFDHYDILSLFGTNITIIRELVNRIHSSIIAA